MVTTKKLTITKIMKHRNSYLNLRTNLFLLLALPFFICFSSCKSDEPKEDGNELVKNNAYGLFLSLWDGQIEKDYINLWISSEVVKAIRGEDENEIYSYLLEYEYDYRPYYLISDERINQYLDEICSSWIGPNADELNAAERQAWLKFLNSNKSKYKYMAKRGDSILLFNRTSDNNY